MFQNVHNARLSSANNALGELLQLVLAALEGNVQPDLKKAVKIGVDAIALSITALHKLGGHRRAKIRLATIYQ